MMTILSIAVLVIGGAIYLKMRSRERGFPLPLALGLLGMAVALVVVRIRASSETPGYEMTRQISLGIGGALGAAIAQQHPGGGQVLVIQPPDLTCGLSGVPERQWSSLEKSLGRKFTLIRPEADSAVQSGWQQSMQPEMSPALAQDLARKYAGVCAVVSFMGLPGSQPGAGWPKDGPRLYVFGRATETNRQDWIRSDRLAALIVPKRPDLVTLQSNPSPADLYDGLYERVK